MIILRKILREDLNMIRVWRMKPEVTKYMYTDPILTEKGQAEWYDAIQKDSECRYWIANYNGVDIGVINLSRIDKTNRRCEWGHYIGEESFRGKGIGYTIECNIYDYVFENLMLEKLCAEVFEFNKNAINLHRKCGSEIEGIRKSHIYKANKSYNVVEMAMLREKWKKIKNKYKYEKAIIEE